MFYGELNMKSSYKALIFDLDGTAMPVAFDALPSDRVAEAVMRAQKVVKVSAATGRPITVCRQILKKLNLTQPCVISGGTQIIDPQTEETLWEKRLSEEQVKQVVDVGKPYSFQILFTDEIYKHGVPAKDKKINGSERVIYFMDVEIKDEEAILSGIENVTDVVAHPVASWNHARIDIHITHAEATKKHAIEILLDILKVDKEDVVGVGDSNNDLPLLNSVGYKVAMGNATNKLKEIADYVAPSVEEDGLATVIEKVILKKPAN
ncbi:HAD family phosphatase [Candidatus Curtissbacteria bacterium]|nr:HAD family phosphatase [Candidatus Curtissbacteria bacterium]